jgi:hypothetical protein
LVGERIGSNQSSWTGSPSNVGVVLVTPRNPDVDDPAAIRWMDQFITTLPFPFLFILLKVIEKTVK